MKKPLWIPLIAAFGTMIVLYIIGSVTNYPMLEFKITLLDTQISLIPVAIGMVVGFITEQILKIKLQK